MKRTQAKRFCETSSKDPANSVGEDSVDFETVYTRLAEQWAPDGPDEEHAVYTMAKCTFLKQLLPSKRTQKQRGEELPEFDRFKHELGNGVNADETERVFQRCCRGRYLLRKVPRNKFDSEPAWMRALKDEIDVLFGWEIAFLEDLREKLGPEVPAEKLSGDTVECELASERLLDEAYDRALDRLLKIKAEKRKISFRERQRFHRSHPIG